MTSPSVLKKDVILLKDEIKRASGVFNDLKKRGKALEESAMEADKELDDMVEKVRERKVGINTVFKNIRQQLVNLRASLQREIIEDTIFDNEIKRIKSLIDIARRQFPSAGSRLAGVESTVELAEEFLRTRLQNCKSFFQNTLNPFMMQTALQPESIPKVKKAYKEVKETTAFLNETSRQAMIKVLSAYSQLYKILPGLERTEKERTRMFE
ncbi:hypothetical protein HYV85_05700 [Candidatus Woesearchaeota archaeon]|nr:hypothetical protein [Candidatus Woesearchaeota archaeon]